MFLLASCLAGLLGAFLVSGVSTERAQHKVTAMHIARGYIDREIKSGYDDSAGSYDYTTVTTSAGDSVTIDDAGTTSTADDLIGAIKPDPYPVPTALSSGTDVHYKTIGFTVDWTEEDGKTCQEKRAVIIADHD